jgi:monoamine oxidase
MTSASLLNSKKILIIGAGIAGLGAYKRLCEYGYDVQILEARDRTGGRICTDYTLGIPIGIGAGFIHGDKNNPVIELINSSSVNKAIVDPSKFVFFDGENKQVSQSAIIEFNIKFEYYLSKAKILALEASTDISLKNALSTVLENETFNSLETNLLHARLISLESYIGAGYELLSGRFWDEEESWDGDNCFLVDSYQPILETLTKNIDIKLNNVVKKIELNENQLIVSTDQSTYYADAVIVTVPLGVLKNKKIKFIPPLPDYKQNAIDRLEMGVFNIISLKFSDAFWPNDYHAMYFSQFDKSSVSVFFNLHSFIKLPILLGYSGGERAKTIEKLDDKEIVEKTMENFRQVYGNDIPEPQSYVISRWSSDPFSFGSYSFIPTGAQSEDYESISKSISDRIFFAGEATSIKHPATTHGAYLSGIREAEAIIKVFQNLGD